MTTESHQEKEGKVCLCSLNTKRPLKRMILRESSCPDPFIGSNTKLPFGLFDCFIDGLMTGVRSLTVSADMKEITTLFARISADFQCNKRRKRLAVSRVLRTARVMMRTELNALDAQQIWAFTHKSQPCRL